MSAVVAALEHVAADLASLNARVARVEGLAVSARADLCLTRNLDCAVAVTDEQDAERLIFALKGLGYRELLVLGHQATGSLATVRLVPPLGTIVARGRGCGKDLAAEHGAFLARAARARAGGPP